MRKRYVAVAAVAAAVLAGPAAAAAQEDDGGAEPTPTAPERQPDTAQATGEMSAEQAAALVKASTVYVTVEWEGYVGSTEFYGEDYWSPAISLTFTCTGFVVNPEGYIVTAGHCVDEEMVRYDFLDYAFYSNGYDPDFDRDLYEVAVANWEIEGLEGDSPPTRAVNVYPTVAASGIAVTQPYAAQVIEFRPLLEGDSALLKVTPTTPMPALELGDAAPVTGAEIASAGFPGSVTDIVDVNMEPSFKTGRVSSMQQIGGVPFMEVDAAMSGGMSGGPTVNGQGQVVGINSMAPDLQSFNLVAPVSTIQQLLARNGVGLTLSDTDMAFREGLDAHFAGDYTAAIAAFDRVLDVVPSHAQAQFYRTQAQAQEPTQETTTTVAPPPPPPQPSPASESSNTMIIIIAVAAVLVIGALTTVIILMRRKPAQAQPVPTYAPPVPPIQPVQVQPQVPTNDGDQRPTTPV